MLAEIDAQTRYFTNIEDIRAAEYPSLAETTYLDHAGTTLYSKSLIEAFSRDLSENLFGNPHSASVSSQLSSRRIEDTRLQVLRFFNAGPNEFDVVFVANATAAIKLVADAFRDNEAGFWYGYHVDSHTSLVGVRELASQGSRCFASDEEVDKWLTEVEQDGNVSEPGLALLAYPGQSNMTGRRISFDWSQRVRRLRQQQQKRVYTLFDAAALASTSPVDLSDLSSAPEITAVSFYKIFGFPDLGALVIRKDAAHVLRHRRYFGGGTVDSVSVFGQPWHEKSESIFSRLEDGTLPFHSVIALQSALKVHQNLYGSVENVARHTRFLASRLEKHMRGLKHGNGRAVCEIYGRPASDSCGDHYGPVIAFNLLNKAGKYVSTTEVEKLAIVNNIQFRTGGLCNPGGIASNLHLTDEDLRKNYAAGHRCGSDLDMVNGRPSGTIRASLGAMSSLGDIDTFLNFLKEYYVDTSLPENLSQQALKTSQQPSDRTFIVESLSVFPIKSCAAYRIPPNTPWKVLSEGLAWDREWCLVHEGTHVALSQKRYPRMALLYPSIDIETQTLRITHKIHGGSSKELTISLRDRFLESTSISTCNDVTSKLSTICGESLDVEHYTSPSVSQFFTEALGVPCTLARFPRTGPIRQSQMRAPQNGVAETPSRSIQLSNESPILLISRSSVNRLNEDIKQRNDTDGVGKAVSADSFRGNIVIAEQLQGGQLESPYVEDEWQSLQIGSNPEASFEILGPCQRCQMVCVNQKDASRRREPFNTLAKTRRRDGRVWFGMHMSLEDKTRMKEETHCYVKVGDKVFAS